MELLQDFPWHNSWVVGLGLAAFVRERRTFGWAVRRCGNHDARVVVAVGVRWSAVSDDRESAGTNAAFDPTKRRSNCRGLVVGREEVVRDIFDKDTLALVIGEQT